MSVWGSGKKQKSIQKVAKYIKKVDKSRKKTEKCVKKYEKVLKSIEKMHSMSYNLITGKGKMSEDKELIRMTSVFDVAKYIYDFYLETTNEKIDELKLQKLLYFCQREKLALLNETLFDDAMEGWVHGPVSVEVRTYFDRDTGINCDTNPLSDSMAV